MTVEIIPGCEATRGERALRLAADMIRRAERDGFGRNAAASVAGIRAHLLTAQRAFAHDHPNPQRAARLGAWIERANALPVERTRRGVDL